MKRKWHEDDDNEIETQNMTKYFINAASGEIESVGRAESRVEASSKQK